MLPWLLKSVLFGYLVFTRSFAYLGLPAAHVFIGEVALAAFMLRRPGYAFGWYLDGWFFRRPFSGFSSLFALFLVYGAFQVVRAVAMNQPLLPALQGFALHYYMFFLLAGLWLGISQPDALPRLLRAIGWINGVYGTLYILWLGQFNTLLPGTDDVLLFAQPGGAAVVILGLLTLARPGKETVTLLTLNGFVLLGLQVRQDWLVLAVALAIYAVFNRKFGRLLFLASFLLVILFAADLFAVQSMIDRTNAISLSEILARALAPIAPEIAQELSRNWLHYAGTFNWRTEWWQAIWRAVHANAGTALLGQGYGTVLSDLVTYISHPVRTPHSVFMFVLGYGGWIGILVFYSLQLSIVKLLWISYRASGEIFGLAAYTGILVGAHFGNTLETPFGAIPAYMIAGMGIAAMYRAESDPDAHPADS